MLASRAVFAHLAAGPALWSNMGSNGPIKLL
jgi:hypothetical protein